jgi:biopolymer transport protein ExbD
MTRIKPNVKAIAKPFTVVPAVDVFFLLLIFFMISSSVTFWPGRKVETEVKLPAVRATNISVADKLIITITSSGDLFFNSKPMGSLEELERELRELVRESTNAEANDQAEGVRRGRRPLVVLRADGGTPYERIAQIEALASELNLDVYELLGGNGGQNNSLPILERDE